MDGRETGSSGTKLTDGMVSVLTGLNIADMAQGMGAEHRSYPPFVSLKVRVTHSDVGPLLIFLCPARKGLARKQAPA